MCRDEGLPISTNAIDTQGLSVPSLPVNIDALPPRELKRLYLTDFEMGEMNRSDVPGVLLNCAIGLVGISVPCLLAVFVIPQDNLLAIVVYLVVGVLALIVGSVCFALWMVTKRKMPRLLEFLSRSK